MKAIALMLAMLLVTHGDQVIDESGDRLSRM